MFLIEYAKKQFINAEEVTTLDIDTNSGFIFLTIKNHTRNFMVSKDYEESFLNDLKTLDANKLTQHKYK
jgi:hypothetical protein|tara:strand:+ start:688 stop:894 length:207 start_codon:yes stop_codon:yes gene_type:complete